MAACLGLTVAALLMAPGAAAPDERNPAQPALRPELSTIESLRRHYRESKPALEPPGSPPGPAGTSWRDAASVLASLVGKVYAGLSVFDALRALDYLETRPEVVRGAIGCAGFSSGASLTAWVATLDRRVKVAGLSGYFGSWRRLAAVHDRLWAATSVMPGFLADLDIHLTLASVAPTPLVVAFEHRGRPEEVRPDVDLVRSVYRGFRAEPDLAIELQPGGHVWHGEIVVPWMVTRLDRERSSRGK